MAVACLASAMPDLPLPVGVQAALAVGSLTIGQHHLPVVRLPGHSHVPCQNSHNASKLVFSELVRPLSDIR
jgi:hypothetical protein